MTNVHGFVLFLRSQNTLTKCNWTSETTLMNCCWATPWHILGSVLVQIMACSLMAPSHYLNNYWLIVKRILWHSPEGNFTKVLMNLIGNTCLKATLKLSPHPPVTTELNGPRKITMGKNTSWTHLKVARFYILYIGISNQLIKWGQLRAWFIFFEHQVKLLFYPLVFGKKHPNQILNALKSIWKT